MNFRDYEIWHDEYKGDDTVNEYWHGILFLPKDKKEELIRLLKAIRMEHGFNSEVNLKFAGCLKKRVRGCCIRDMLNLFQHVLMVREDKANTDFIYRSHEDIHKKEIPEPFLSVRGLFDCKFALLKIPDNHKSMDYFSEYPQKVETTFRFIFKNGCHSFFSKNNPALISGAYFDGCEQYGRGINMYRIIPSDLREYVSVNENFIIDDREISKRNDDTKMIINFVDNIVGGLTAKIKNLKDDNMILHPLKEIYGRLHGDQIFLLEKSRWYKSIISSEVFVVDGKIDFPNLFRNQRQSLLL